MGTNLGALLDHHDREVRIDLLEVDRSGQTGRTGPDNHHVIVHAFAFWQVVVLQLAHLVLASCAGSAGRFVHLI